MGAFKTDADRTSKRLLKTRIETLEKKVRLLDAVMANLVRDIGAKVNFEAALRAQPGAAIVPTYESGSAVLGGEAATTTQETT